ncbi:sulfatase-like hydrolase/transferase [Maritimibacter dapengensis]|uniref:Sulfatase-like hydrolase/transferase n=1 Tax=Maritimibacter dapengensis TaxID=2836868 RepID=A0ABS6T5X3_9RHOB|nr:sulfatase-like hydrolase/transferase [Maritimibacter dapengensis]MBV7380614.1 sulfatase-like hydrolase/transferase [Maritimibacter dapengensis]
MANAKNILFIMFDQLRWDYLSCYGHPHLQTPNIDRIASMGVRFTNARIQSPLCGPSRMSTYTGRYVHSHGAAWNGYPLRVGEMTMGDHLRKLGMDAVLVGKTHMQADAEGMQRLGLEPDSIIGARQAECGFDAFERDDGLAFESNAGPNSPFVETHSAAKYNTYLKAKGYDGENPWHDYANSGLDDDGNVLSGWFLKYSDQPANIAEEDSETPYMTRRGIEFIEQAGDTPWLCHLSLIKPHWPYIVPAPYHDMYGPEHMLAPVRSDAEKQTDHPVLAGLLQWMVSRTFARDDVREKVLQAYMGLIKQIDDQMGVLFKFLEDTGRMEDTMIVLNSDHGDYMGDHWLGEKMFFHDTSVKVPLIIYDPSSKADATRGTTSDALVEMIDLAPTFYEVAGGDASDVDHILEGQSLVPILHGTGNPDREVSFCEYDFGHTPQAEAMKLAPNDARMFMVATRDWKLIHFEGGFRPILFDLANDPNELVDLGKSPDHAEHIEAMYAHLHAWALRNSQRVTVPTKRILLRRKNMEIGKVGILIGVNGPEDLPPGAVDQYIGRKAVDKRAPT